MVTSVEVMMGLAVEVATGVFSSTIAAVAVGVAMSIVATGLVRDGCDGDIDTTSVAGLHPPSVVIRIKIIMINVIWRFRFMVFSLISS